MLLVPDAVYISRSTHDLGDLYPSSEYTDILIIFNMNTTTRGRRLDRLRASGATMTTPIRPTRSRLQRLRNSTTSPDSTLAKRCIWLTDDHADMIMAEQPFKDCPIDDTRPRAVQRGWSIKDASTSGDTTDQLSYVCDTHKNQEVKARMQDLDESLDNWETVGGSEGFTKTMETLYKKLDFFSSCMETRDVKDDEFADAIGPLFSQLLDEINQIGGKVSGSRSLDELRESVTAVKAIIEAEVRENTVLCFVHTSF